GFWAALMPNVEHTAYSAAKFAVKGFTEALITDFRNNALQLKAHVVMPGAIGTPIGLNSRRVLAGDGALSEREKDQMRKRLAAWGVAGAEDMDEAALLEAEGEMIRRFQEMAP